MLTERSKIARPVTQLSTVWNNVDVKFFKNVEVRLNGGPDNPMDGENR